MEQGSSVSALVARTAGMTDEQILDLDLDAFQKSGVGGAVAPGPPTSSFGGPGDSSNAWQGQVPLGGNAPATSTPTSLRAEAPLTGDFGLGAVTSPQDRAAAPGVAEKNAQGEPAWLKQLEAQPAAAAEARQWREAAQNVAALDAAYFSGDAGARSGLAARLYENDPAAFREMLAAGARMLSERDPQALAELARRLGMSEAQTPNAPRSLAQAARAPGFSVPAESQGVDYRSAAFPAEAYRAFEAATNEDVARTTRDAIDRTLGTTLPDGIGEGARRRIGDDIFHELHSTLSADRELSQRVGEILRGWNFDGATRQHVVSLISSRSRAVMPEVARRVVAEWTSSVLASDRARAARVDAASSRHDVMGGRVPDTIPKGALLPRKIDYSKMTDEQILDL